MEIELTREQLEEIKRAILNYYGTGMQFNPIAMMEYQKAENMTEEEIIEEAIKLKLLK